MGELLLVAVAIPIVSWALVIGFLAVFCRDCKTRKRRLL